MPGSSFENLGTDPFEGWRTVAQQEADRRAAKKRVRGSQKVSGKGISQPPPDLPQPDLSYDQSPTILGTAVEAGAFRHRREKRPANGQEPKHLGKHLVPNPDGKTAHWVKD